jgi:hypothetical protein
MHTGCGHAGTFVGTSGQSAAAGAAAAPVEFVLAEGKGWKLGYDRKPSNPNAYSALVGSDSWSLALTPAEYEDFIQARHSCQGFLRSCSSAECMHVGDYTYGIILLMDGLGTRRWAVRM